MVFLFAKITKILAWVTKNILPEKECCLKEESCEKYIKTAQK